MPWMPLRRSTPVAHQGVAVDVRLRECALTRDHLLGDPVQQHVLLAAEDLLAHDVPVALPRRPLVVGEPQARAARPELSLCHHPLEAIPSPPTCQHPPRSADRAPAAPRGAGQL